MMVVRAQLLDGYHMPSFDRPQNLVRTIEFTALRALRRTNEIVRNPRHGGNHHDQIGYGVCVRNDCGHPANAVLICHGCSAKLHHRQRATSALVLIRPSHLRVTVKPERFSFPLAFPSRLTSAGMQVLPASSCSVLVPKFLSAAKADCFDLPGRRCFLARSIHSCKSLGSSQGTS